MPDGLAYVASAKEVWVTTPRDKSLTVLDASVPGALTLKTKMTLEGEPEGYVVDEGRGIFYTNLEDKDKTLSIDIASHKITNTWNSSCGEDGPKGLALDRALDFLFVACADKVKVLDAGHDGKELSSLATGDGVDNIDYSSRATSFSPPPARPPRPRSPSSTTKARPRWWRAGAALTALATESATPRATSTS